MKCFFLKEERDRDRQRLLGIDSDIQRYVVIAMDRWRWIDRDEQLEMDIQRWVDINGYIEIDRGEYIDMDRQRV